VVPHALQKAESLEKHVKHLGTGKSGFVLALTLGEAYELLDYLIEQYGQNSMLIEDVNRAKVTSNPWPVLENFELLGFPLTRVVDLN
jgi:hypothetical protein